MSPGGGRTPDASSGDSHPDPVGPEFYDGTDYFEAASRHLRDMESPFQRYRLQKVLQIYRPGKEERVLDLGCGWGTFTFALAPTVQEVVGVDFSQAAVKLCREEVAARRLDNVRLVRADAAETGLEAESFDLIIAADLLEHLTPNQTEDVFDECRRVLKRGGRLTLWTPHRGHLLELLRNNRILMRPDPSHVDYKSMERIRRLLLDRRFMIEKQYYAESHVPVLRALERTFMSYLPLLRRRIAVLARKA